MYAIYLIGVPGSSASIFNKSIFHESYFPECENISLISTIFARSIENNRSFEEEFKNTDFLELYKSFQRRINQAVKEERNIVLDIIGTTRLMRNRFVIPSNYSKVAINFNRSQKIIDRNLSTLKCLKKVQYPKTFLDSVTTYKTPIEDEEKFEWVLEDEEFTSREWVDFWRRKIK